VNSIVSSELTRHLCRISPIKEVIAARILTKSRAEWSTVLEGTDACVSPVLSMTEAPQHPHLKARGTFVEIDGIVQPGPAPRFSRTQPDVPTPPEELGQSTEQALAEWGWSAAEIASLREKGVIGAVKR
jgi:alpha-methylacyl-CoA racemase